MGNPTDELRARLNELGVEHIDNDYKTVRYTRWNNGGKREVMYKEWSNGTTRLDASNVTPEQAIAATVGVEKWEPSKEWKVWYDSLKHDNPTSIREAVENILYEAIDFGGDMGPNGNVWSGVDEGTVLTENCIDGWVESVESIAATVGAGTCHVIEDEDTGYLTCSECGAIQPDDYTVYHCWCCGKKIKED